MPTELGDATYHTSFSPEEILSIQVELERTMEHLVLKDELHLTYVITPMYGLPLIDWERYWNEFYETK